MQKKNFKFVILCDWYDSKGCFRQTARAKQSNHCWKKKVLFAFSVLAWNIVAKSCDLVIIFFYKNAVTKECLVFNVAQCPHQVKWHHLNFFVYKGYSFLISYVPITSFFLPLNATSCPKLRLHSLCYTPRDSALINKGLLSARDKSRQGWVSIPRPSDSLPDALPTELSWADDIEGQC